MPTDPKSNISQKTLSESLDNEIDIDKCRCWEEDIGQLPTGCELDPVAFFPPFTTRGKGNLPVAATSLPITAWVCYIFVGPVSLHRGASVPKFLPATTELTAS